MTGSFRLVVARGFCTYISSCGDTRLVVNGQVRCILSLLCSFYHYNFYSKYTKYSKSFTHFLPLIVHCIKLQISGTTQVPVIITDLYTSAYIYSGYVTAFVEVTESSTEISTNASTSFQIYDDSQYLSVILDRTFKPKSTLPITVIMWHISL